MAALDHNLLQKIIDCDDPKDVCDDFCCRYENSVYPPPEEYRNLLLCASIQYGHGTLIDKLLMEREGDAVKKEMGFAASRPLHTAVKHGSVELVHQLLEFGLDVHQEGASGIWKPGSGCMDIGTPLALAIQKDDPTMMNLLREHYRPELTRQKQTPLHYACKYNAVKCCLSLFEEDSLDVNAKDDQGSTPLMFAVQKSPIIVKCLLGKGADVNASMLRIGHSALELSVIPSRENCVREFSEVLRMLISAGADVTRVTSQGEESPLTLLCGNLFPLSSEPSQTELDLHGRQVLQSANYLLHAGALQSKCRLNSITCVLQRLYSIAGTLSYASITPGQVAQTYKVEAAFELGLKLIDLLLKHRAEANSCENRARKTAAAQVLWIIESRTRQSWLTGNNPHLSIRPQGSCFILNDNINTNMLYLFTRLLLFGSTITSPPEYTCLFSLLRVDFDRFAPYMRGFLNSLTHDKWVEVMQALCFYIKDAREKLSGEQHAKLKCLTETRTLKQICLAEVIYYAQSTPDPANSIAELPLPTIIKQDIASLRD